MTQHPLLIETVKAYSGAPMGNWFADLSKSVSAEWEKAKTQISTQLEAEKNKAITQGLTQLKAEATNAVNSLATKVLSDPTQVAKVKEATSSAVTEKIAETVKPVVDYAVNNPKKTALIVGGILVGTIVLLTFAGKGAVAGIVSKKTNPRRKTKRKSRRSKR